MSERKGHGNRSSLMDLGKPRLAQSPLSAPIHEAERLILNAGAETSLPQSHVEDYASTVSTLDNELPQSSPDHKSAPAIAALDNQSHESAYQQTEMASRSSKDDIVARLRKAREPIAVVGFKLPAKLKDELAIVAQYNDTDMTRIVVEALSRLLPELPHPPNWKP
jgi:hypothetical protein